MRIRRETGDFRAFEAAQLAPGEAALFWLGQAGFALRYESLLVLIDPYLSDSLAVKYAGKKFSHERMMASPVQPEELRNVDLCLSTHGHSDHMDPGTLPIVAAHNPDCRFVAPRAETGKAVSIGLSEELLLGVNADEVVATGGLRIHVVPSAHEELKTNAAGDHFFLGYVLEMDRIHVYHAGDCAPYDGLAETLRPFSVDLALLPVNGRDEYRRSNGVPGNMTFEEAATLCRDAGIKHMVPHHFGMFAFNTADPAEVRRRCAGLERVEGLFPDTQSYLVAGHTHEE